MTGTNKISPWRTGSRWVTDHLLRPQALVWIIWLLLWLLWLLPITQWEHSPTFYISFIWHIHPEWHAVPFLWAQKKQMRYEQAYGRFFLAWWPSFTFIPQDLHCKCVTASMILLQVVCSNDSSLPQINPKFMFAFNLWPLEVYWTVSWVTDIQDKPYWAVSHNALQGVKITVNLLCVRSVNANYGI